MYTFQVVNKEIKSGNLYLSIQFTSDTDQFTETAITNDPSDKWFNDVTQGRIDSLNRMQSFSDKIDAGEITDVKGNMVEVVALETPKPVVIDPPVEIKPVDEPPIETPIIDTPETKDTIKEEDTNGTATNLS